jgi:hypothetical protein
MNSETRAYADAVAAVLVGVLTLLNTPAVLAGQQRDWFASELDAVMAAASRYNPVSINEDREYMGAIVRQHDCYAYTVAAGQRRRDRITVRISVDAGADVVAFWHTHGAAYPGNRFFSDVDTRLVEKWQKPLYLADFTGALKVMFPGGRKLSTIRARALGLPTRAGYAKGQVVRDANGKPAKILTRLQMN